MISRSFAFLLSLICPFLIALPANTASASKGSTAPGTYRDWNREIDQVSILQTFRLDDYNDIAVVSFDTSGVELPNPKDNTYEAVRAAMASIKPAFLEGFQEKLRRKTSPNAPRGRGKALIIRVKVVKLDPGSQAARYWVGFGAGAVKIQVNGDVVDAASHKTLVRFDQERRSAVGAFGGGYSELFARTARQIGGDIAGLLNAF